MDSIKLQFIHTHEESLGPAKKSDAGLFTYLQKTVPNLFELDSDSVSAVLSLDIERLLFAMNIHHPGNSVQFKYVQYERIKNHQDNSYKTLISLKSDIFKILDAPVIHGKHMTFIGIEGEGDRLRSYSVLKDEKIHYILSDNIIHIKTKKPLKLTG